MNRLIMNYVYFVFLLAISISVGSATTSCAAIISNGGFENGLTGWTTANQLGSEGTFSLQLGTLSPVLSNLVPAPPSGLRTAMSDAQGPGTHVLYQDIVIPNNVGPHVLTFSLFVGNRSTAFAVADPATVGLDFSSAAQNQQARVDILRGTANPFSVAAADVLRNFFQTAVGSPLVSGYTTFNFDATALLQANAGQTLRLRFAEVDNLGPFQLGVDNVDFVAVPEPSSCIFVCAGGLLAMVARRIRRKSLLKYSDTTVIG